MGSYTMNYVAAQKKMRVTTEGFFTPAEAQTYIKEYKTKVAALNAKECILEVDATRQSVTDSEVKKLLAEAFKLYQSSGFKSVVIETGGNAIFSMQCKNIAKENGFNFIIN